MFAIQLLDDRENQTIFGIVGGATVEDAEIAKNVVLKNKDHADLQKMNLRIFPGHVDQISDLSFINISTVPLLSDKLKNLLTAHEKIKEIAEFIPIQRSNLEGVYHLLKFTKPLDALDHDNSYIYRNEQYHSIIRNIFVFSFHKEATSEAFWTLRLACNGSLPLHLRAVRHQEMVSIEPIRISCQLQV